MQSSVIVSRCQWSLSSLANRTNRLSLMLACASPEALVSFYLDALAATTLRVYSIYMREEL